MPHGFRPIRGLEFIEDIRERVAHSLTAQDKPLGDLGVVVARRDQAEDFALGEFGEKFRG